MRTIGLKDEAKDQENLKVEEEVRFSEELRLKAEKEEQAHLKAEEERRHAEEFILKGEAEGFYGAGVEI